jgi:hypothetical protein
MSDVWRFLEQRWYWVVGAVFGLLAVYLLMRGRGSSSAPATPSAVVSAGPATVDPNVLAANASLQAAQVQAQSQQAGYTAAAAAQVQTAQLALQQQQDYDASQVNLGTSGNAAAVQINQSNNDAAVLQTQYNDSTAVALQNGIDTTNLNAVMSNNNTAVQMYGIQAGVANNAITTAGNVDLATTAAQEAEMSQYYDTSATIADANLQAQKEQFNAASSMISSGVFNKGGQGGTATLSAFNTLLNPTASAPNTASVAQVGVAQQQASASTIASVMGAISKVLGGSSSATSASGASTAAGVASLFA